MKNTRKQTAEHPCASYTATESAKATRGELVEFIIDHGQQLAAMALSAGRPKVSALLTLAVTELRARPSE